MPEGSLVVVTQNAWGGAPLWSKRRAHLARSIAAQRADIVGLQEVHSDAPTGEASQADELARELDGYDTLFAPGRVTASGHAEGVALLIKRPHVVVERSVLALSLDAKDPLEGPHQRVVLRAAVRVGETIVDALVTHASLSKAGRSRTLPEIRDFAARERTRSASAGAVLLGDFNATPGDPALAALAGAGWTDAWTHANPAARGGTWPAGAPFRRIDYVWVQKGEGWRIDGCVRMPVAGSDHMGLVATLRWP